MIKTVFAIAILLFGSNSFAQGIVSTVEDTSAFRFTDDLIFDNSGNLYCADYSGDAIYKRTPGGNVSVFASGMNTPNGMAFDTAGNLFVCDNIGNAIYKISSSGTFLDTFPVLQPSGMIKDAMSDTMIFTTYGAQSKIQKLAPDGSIIDFHTGTPLNGPVGLEYCQGELYVANFSNREIYRVEADTLVFIAQLPGSGNLGFLAVVGNYLMATAFTNHKIYTIDPISQTVQLYSGGSSGHVDGSATVARFTTPNGIVANATGDTIYISEYNTRRLRMITDFTAENPIVSSSPTIQLYPNPCSEKLNLTVNPSDLPYSLRIVDLTGKVIYQMDAVVDSTVELDLSAFKTGSYVVEIQSPHSKMSVARMLKID